MSILALLAWLDEFCASLTIGRRLTPPREDEAEE